MFDRPPRRSVEDLQASGVLLVEDGNHGEYRPRPDEFVADGEAFIRAADMSNGQVQFTTCSRINGEARARIRKGVGMPNDILLSHKGTVGKLARANSDCEPFVCSPQTTFWRVIDGQILDRDYLFYFMRSTDFENQLRRVQGETDMAPYVSLTAQRRLTVPIPALDIQRAMTGVLKALDNKIALNRRVAETLEGIAHALFQSWFIDFDPLRQATSIQQSDLPGEIANLFPTAFADDDLPEGWTLTPLDDLVDVVRTSVQPRDLPASTPYVGLEHIPRKRLMLDAVGVAADVHSQKISFLKGDILFGKLRSYFHKVVVAPMNGICSSDIIVMRAKCNDLKPLVYLMVSSEDFVEASSAAATGTRMPRAEWTQMSSYKIAVPGSSTLHRFNEVVLPIFDRLDVVRAQNATLESMRDALLPRLFSGDLSVQHAATIVAKA